MVSRQQTQEDSYSQGLVAAAVQLIKTEWDPSPAPTWVTAVPSQTDGGTVRDLARRIAAELDVEYVQAVEQVQEMWPQHELVNSYQTRWNVEGVFQTPEAVQSDQCCWSMIPLGRDGRSPKCH